MVGPVSASVLSSETLLICYMLIDTVTYMRQSDVIY